MSALGQQLGQLRVRSCERDSLWTGLAGPTNNDVCLNGAGAALTLYTPCQFPPVRHSVNCCRHSVNLISSEKSSGFLRSWHLDLHRGDLSSERPVWHLSVTRWKLSSNLSKLCLHTAEVPASKCFLSSGPDSSKRLSSEWLSSDFEQLKSAKRELLCFAPKLQRVAWIRRTSDTWNLQL